MRIAILGASSQIATDLVFALAQGGQHEPILFSRRPEELVTRLAQEAIAAVPASLRYDDFASGYYDAIINFVGAGDPARLTRMGGSILDITAKFDALSLDYLNRRPATRYLFLSSGAAYHSTFLVPAGRETQASFAINELTVQDFYSIAKLHAECRHRAIPDAAIIDVRVFNYMTRRADIEARFFVTDILRAVHRSEVLQTNADSMRRDFITPVDFTRLVECLLDGPAANVAVDAYSLAPVEKFELLGAMRAEFGLRYEVVSSPLPIGATGTKPEYYSVYRRAAEFGYQPTLTSLDGVMTEARALLQRLRIG